MKNKFIVLLELIILLANVSQEECGYVNGYSSNIEYRSLLPTPDEHGRRKIENDVILAQRFYKT